MKIKFWVCTNRVGSKVERIIEFDDEEVEGMSSKEIDEYIDDQADDIFAEMIEQGWDII